MVSAKLPENAYTELKSGEKYVPVIPAEQKIPEVTLRSVIWGIIWSVIFSFSAAYLILKVGQGFEAAIPIAVLAVGAGRLYGRRSTILENVIVQSIGSVSGVIVGGAVFTIPALYALQLDPGYLKIVLTAAFGGVIGIYFLIPLRQHFIVDEHGRLPFPEGTAATEILVSGEEGGEQAKVLAVTMIVGGIYEFIASNMFLWKERIDFLGTRLGETVSNLSKIELRIDAVPSIIGLGYIIGFKYSAIIVSGSVFANWVIVPVIYFFGGQLPDFIPQSASLIKDIAPSAIFNVYVKNIGIGAIGMAGLIKIVQAAGIIRNGFEIGFREVFIRGHTKQDSMVRTDKNISMKYIIIGIVVTFILLWIFFQFGLSTGLRISVTGLIITFLISFLFTSVSAHTIALVGQNPVSGMTLVTIIISGAIFYQLGARGNEGIVITLMIGGVIATALAVSGSFAGDLKIGYWIGSTPRSQQRCKFIGVIFSSLAAGIAIWLLAQTYWFGEAPVGVSETRQILPAPQAQLMKTVIRSIMSDQPQPWFLFGTGAVISLILHFIGIAPMVFALGMYLPLELNTPFFIGGLIACFVKKSSDNKDLSEKRHKKGILIASGFIAGGALMGILGALLKFLNCDRFISLGIPYVLENGRWVPDMSNPAAWFENFGEMLSILMFVGLCVYMYKKARNA